MTLFQCPTTATTTTTEEPVEYEIIEEETLSYQSSNQEEEAPSKMSFHKNSQKEYSAVKNAARNDEYSAVKNAAGNDEYDVFGQLVAHKLRKLTPRNRLLAERRVFDVFFDLEQEERKQRCRTPFPRDPLNT